MNRKPLIIDDVYKLKRNAPYSFNRTFDETSLYHTQSVLTVPLITSRDKVTGVMQIINSKNEKGMVVPFSKDDEILVFNFLKNIEIVY